MISIKRIATVLGMLAGIVLLASLASTQSSTQGGGLSTRAIQGLEQCFNSSGTFICAPSGGGTPVGGSGTVNTIPKWTASSTLGNSLITDTGPPAAGVSGTIFSLSGTLNAMNGSDTVDWLNINISNADHTGTGNNLNALRIDNSSNDADATETAVRVGGLFDTGIFFLNTVFQPQTNIRSNSGPLTYQVGTSPNALFSMVIDFTGNDQAYFSLNSGITILRHTGVGSIIAPGIMDGSDNEQFIEYGGFTDANHTSTANVLSVVRADTITSPDANAIHAVIRQDAGWNALALVEAGGAWAPTFSPAANKVAFFIDEATNRTGGAGADCTLVARLSSGTEVSVATLVTDGGCP